MTLGAGICLPFKSGLRTWATHLQAANPANASFWLTSGTQHEAPKIAISSLRPQAPRDTGQPNSCTRLSPRVLPEDLHRRPGKPLDLRPNSMPLGRFTLSLRNLGVFFFLRSAHGVVGCWSVLSADPAGGRVDVSSYNLVANTGFCLGLWGLKGLNVFF